jgi:hypothetical protein
MVGAGNVDYLVFGVLTCREKSPSGQLLHDLYSGEMEVVLVYKDLRLVVVSIVVGRLAGLADFVYHPAEDWSRTGCGAGCFQAPRQELVSFDRLLGVTVVGWTQGNFHWVLGRPQVQKAHQGRLLTVEAPVPSRD